MRSEGNANCYAKWDNPVAFSNITSNGEKNPVKTSAILKRTESFFRPSSSSYWGWCKSLILRPCPWSLWHKVDKGVTALVHKVSIMFLYSVSHDLFSPIELMFFSRFSTRPMSKQKKLRSLNCSLSVVLAMATDEVNKAVFFFCVFFFGHDS